jgi:anthranilate synthase component 1
VNGNGLRRVDAAQAAVVTLDVFPDLARLHAANPQRYPHLLESAVQGTPRGRYDILFAFPGSTVSLSARGVERDGKPVPGTFLETLEEDWQREALPAMPPAAAEDGLPFSGGWFVFLGYELASEIEPTLATHRSDESLPVAFATRFRAAVIRDHGAHVTQLVCEIGSEELLEAMRADLNRVVGESPRTQDLEIVQVTEDPRQQFLDGVERVLDYIRAGDVYQVNVSRGWRAELAAPVPPVVLYRRLRAANPAPFAGLLTLPGNRAVASSSPERLVRVRARRISTRPIAGTYPRGADAEADARLARELLAHPKERAEHIMLIDLERNDLGRVCRSGSVRVNELMTLETYRHVHHIVSEVSGELRAGVTPAQVIRAVFPGGTITGCPKLRCMQIIHELEPVARTAYTGSMGYINRDGSMDLNILIRTLVQDDRTVHLRAGAGIVADSRPQRELEETRAKARGLLAALGAV